MAADVAKADTAFRTIGEVSADTGLPHHILRYWESRFPQLRPVTRAGNRRYYRPEDVALVRRIDTLLHHEGYTLRGVQQLLARKGPAAAVSTDETAAPQEEATTAGTLTSLRGIRDRLAQALAQDDGRLLR